VSNIFDALRKQRSDISERILDASSEALPDESQSALIEPALVMQAVVPRAEEPARPSERIDELRMLGAGVRTLPLRIAKTAPLFPFDAVNRAASEQYRILRTKIIQHPKRPKMVVVSSASPRDGKTVTAVNLAAALSLKGPTLLVDGDFRRSTIAKDLGLPETPGLSEYLEGLVSIDEAVIRLEQYSNLYVVTAGNSRCNPAELLESPRWGVFCSAARKNFEHVIIDSPPIPAVADYELLQAAMDGVIVVVQPDHTKRKPASALWRWFRKTSSLVF
jgi:capsular exopolysaccharide synthesis family protein